MGSALPKSSKLSRRTSRFGINRCLGGSIGENRTSWLIKSFDLKEEKAILPPKNGHKKVDVNLEQENIPKRKETCWRQNAKSKLRGEGDW